MKVFINQDLCAGFGVCVELSENIFELHDDGYAIVKVAQVPPELEDKMREAVLHCPSNAIHLTDDD